MKLYLYVIVMTLLWVKEGGRAEGGRREGGGRDGGSQHSLPSVSNTELC